MRRRDGEETFQRKDKVVSSPIFISASFTYRMFLRIDQYKSRSNWKQFPAFFLQFEWPEVDLGSDIEGKCLGLVGDDCLVVVLRQLKHLEQGAKTESHNVNVSWGLWKKALKSTKKIHLWVNRTFPRADQQQQHQWKHVFSQCPILKLNFLAN